MGFLRDIFETENGRHERLKQECSDNILKAAEDNDIAGFEKLQYDNAWCIDKGMLNHALLVAADHNHVEMIDKLVEAGADVNFNGGALYTTGSNGNGTYTITHAGLTPLMAAAKSGAIDAMETLLGLKADIDAVMEDGRSALMHTAENGWSDSARMLLYAGADIHFRNSHNKRALEIAQDKEYHEVVRILKAAYAKQPLPEVAHVANSNEAGAPLPAQTHDKGIRL